jgi:hypothetical protein
MGLLSVAAKAILVTVSLVVATLGIAALVVIFAHLDRDPLDVLYVMAALITVPGAVIGLIRWVWRRR